MSTLSFEEFKKKYSSSNNTGISKAKVASNTPSKSLSFEEFKQKYSSIPATQPTVKPTIPQTTQQDIETARNLMNATNTKSYDQATQQVTIRNKPTQQSTRNARRNLQADKNSNVVGQTIKNIGVGSTSTIANMLEHIQDNNAITSHQDYMTALAQSAEELYGDKSPLEMTRKERMAEKRRLENFDLGERQQQIIEERAQQRYEDTDKVTQALRDIRQQEIEDTAQLPKWQQQIANAGFVVGDMVPTVAAGTLGGPLASNTALFMNAKQNAYNQAIENGATHEQAYWNSMLSAGAELGLETLSGGAFNKLAKVPGVANVSKWTQGIKNPIVRGTANLIGDVVGEGTEEVASTLVQPLIDRITYNPQAPLASIQDVWTSFTDSIIPTLMFGGINAGSTAIQKASIRRSAEQVANKQKAEIDKANIPENEKVELKKQVDIAKEQTIQQIELNTEKNITPQSPQIEQTQPTNEVIPPAQQNQNTANMVQNNANVQNVAQNEPNIEQISQNNAENAQNLQKTVQNKIDAKVAEYIEANKNNFRSDINIETNKILEKENYGVLKEASLFKKAKDLFSTIGKKVFLNSNEQIHVTNRDINESIRKTITNPTQRAMMKENLAVFSQLDKIIENAQEISSEPIDGKGRTQYSDYKYYVSQAIIDGKKFIVEFDTRMQEGTSGKPERHFRLERLYKLNEVDSTTSTAKAINQFGIESTSNNIIQPTENYVNSQEDFALPTAEELNKPSQKMIEAAQAMTLEEKTDKGAREILDELEKEYGTNEINKKIRIYQKQIDSGIYDDSYTSELKKQIEEEKRWLKALSKDRRTAIQEELKNNKLSKKDKEILQKELQSQTLEESVENIADNENANKVSYTNDFYRNMRQALGEKAGKELTGKFDARKLKHVQTMQKFANELKTYVVDGLGIKMDSEMSADVQRYGEKILSLDDIKSKYPEEYTKIIEADKWFRKKYDELIDSINETRKEIYPNVEEKIQETKDALFKTYDLIKEAEKTGIAPYKIDQDIQDSIKRLDERMEAKKEKIAEIEKANRPNYQNTKKYTSLVEQLRTLEENKNELERTIGKRYDEKVERLKQRAQRLSNLLNSEELWVGKRIQKRENYYRHFQEMAEGFKALHNIFTTPAEISSKLAGTSEYTKPKSKFLGLAQRRLTNETEYDAVKGFLNYLEPASYAMNIDPFITELRDITKTIQEKTTQSKNANELIEYLSDFANSLAGKTNPFDRLPQKLIKRKGIKALEWTANRIKSNAVLGNINSSISQILNLPQVVGKVKNPKILARALGDLATGKGKYQDSQFIQERYHSDIMNQFNTKLLDQPKKFATWMLGALDEAVTKTGWNAVYRQAIQQGIENPIQYADDTMRNLVAGRGIGERTLAQESKIGNLLMPFTVETGNYWRVMKDFVREKDFGGILITYIVGWLLNRGIEAIGASGKTFDPIDAIYDAITEEDLTLLERFGRVGGEILSSMPMGQQIASLYPEYGADFGIFELPAREDLFGSNDPTRFGTGNILSNTFTPAIPGLPIPNIVLPWGGTQLKRTAEGLGALIKGGDYKTNSKGEEQLKFPINLEDKNIAEKILTSLQVLTLGKYAPKEADKYFEDGALSATETKGYKQALSTGMSAEEFYDIMESIEELEIPKRKNKEGKEESVPGARKKLIKEELNSRKELTDEQRKLLYDIFYKREL